MPCPVTFEDQITFWKYFFGKKPAIEFVEFEQANRWLYSCQNPPYKYNIYLKNLLLCLCRGLSSSNRPIDGAMGQPLLQSSLQYILPGSDCRRLMCVKASSAAVTKRARLFFSRRSYSCSSQKRSLWLELFLRADEDDTTARPPPPCLLFFTQMNEENKERE